MVLPYLENSYERVCTETEMIFGRCWANNCVISLIAFWYCAVVVFPDYNPDYCGDKSSHQRCPKNKACSTYCLLQWGWWSPKKAVWKRPCTDCVADNGVLQTINTIISSQYCIKWSILHELIVSCAILVVRSLFICYVEHNLFSSISFHCSGAPKIWYLASGPCIVGLKISCKKFVEWGIFNILHEESRQVIATKTVLFNLVLLSRNWSRVKMKSIIQNEWQSVTLAPKT